MEMIRGKSGIARVLIAGAFAAVAVAGMATADDKEKKSGCCPLTAQKAAQVCTDDKAKGDCTEKAKSGCSETVAAACDSAKASTCGEGVAAVVPVVFTTLEGPAKVGEKAPDFRLTDTEGKTWQLSELTKEGKIVVLEWFNPDCPWVVKHHMTQKTMSTIAAEYKAKNVVWLAINSGAPGKQGHGLEHNQRARERFEMKMPVLLDETGVVGKAYGARVTPHMYVIDKEGILRYNGAICSDRSVGNVGDRVYVREALDAVLAGETVPTTETRPYGCSVKYPG